MKRPSSPANEQILFVILLVFLALSVGLAYYISGSATHSLAI